MHCFMVKIVKECLSIKGKKCTHRMFLKNKRLYTGSLLNKAIEIKSNNKYRLFFKWEVVC